MVPYNFVNLSTIKSFFLNHPLVVNQSGRLKHPTSDGAIINLYIQLR
jgi:hypothetical protein